MLKKLLKGFTFTELMIAMSLNSILFVALTSVFITGLDHYNTIFNANLLHAQLQAAMDTIAADVRRAGYWSLASSIAGTHSNTNPFMSATTDISVGSSNSCILFAYDHTNSGALPSISSSYDDLRYGYRLINSAIQSRPWGATYSCSAAATNWINITDTNIVTISTLNFAMTNQVVTSGSHSITVRNIIITLTGYLTSTPTVT
ncbi:MAG TPA: prepilin-type N-terminal cleavage/methylation domain-containing protein, partial [Gammaproteobacteria bacterium]|nr:prepilin-type N-terminal cleavage/methylation domain-containing protein [Gammaproteobacteria bacterium]